MNKGLLAADDEKIEYIRKEKKDIIEIFILQDDAEMLMKYLELFDDISDKEIKKYISAAEKQNSEKVAYALKNPTDATEGGEKTEKVTAKAANDTKDIAEIYRIEEKVKILKDIPIPAEAKVFEKGIMYNNNKIAMTGEGNQFTVTADMKGTYIGYAILKNGDAYTLLTDGEYVK